MASYSYRDKEFSLKDSLIEVGCTVGTGALLLLVIIVCEKEPELALGIAKASLNLVKEMAWGTALGHSLGVLAGMDGGGGDPTPGKVNELTMFIENTNMSNDLKNHLKKVIDTLKNETLTDEDIMKFIKDVGFSEKELEEMKKIMNHQMRGFSVTPSTATPTANPTATPTANTTATPNANRNYSKIVNSRLQIATGGTRRKYTSRGRKVHHKKQTRKH